MLRSHHDKLAEEKAACVEKIKELNAKVKDLEKGLIKQEEELRKKLIDLQVVGERFVLFFWGNQFLGMLWYLSLVTFVYSF